MTAQVVATITSVTSAEYWADRISKAHAASVEAIVNTGRELLEAKAKLPHGEWGRLTGEKTRQPMLPFSSQTAQRFMAIAAHSSLSNPAHVRDLPASWGTLAVLAQLPADVVERQIAEQVIHPELERKTAEDLVAEHKQATEPKNAPLFWPLPSQPTATAAPRVSPDPQRLNELKAELNAELAKDRALAIDDEQRRRRLRETPTTQAAWHEVLLSMSVTNDRLDALLISLEDRLQPLPPIGGELHRQISERLALLRQFVATLSEHLNSNYLEKNHARNRNH